MANAFRKVGNFLGLVDDEEMYEATVALPETRRPRTISPLPTPVRNVETPSYMKSSHSTEMVESPINRIVTLHPRVYGDVRSIGEHYRNGEPVIMNLTDMEESERKRVVDFASGLVFGHNGKIERVTSKVFLLTPPNVTVSNEEKSAVANASFFDQS